MTHVKSTHILHYRFLKLKSTVGGNEMDHGDMKTVPVPTAMVVGDKRLWDITGQFRTLAAGETAFSLVSRCIVG
jgi:hypothetical protein